MGDSPLPDYSELMLRFRRGFARADRDLLEGAIAADFEWHTHTFPPDAPNPTGRILHGIDGVMREIERRRTDWSDVRFDDLVEHYAPGIVTQSFTISGIDRGRPFSVRAVDVYTITDDERIRLKDTYWKQPAPGA